MPRDEIKDSHIAAQSLYNSIDKTRREEMLPPHDGFTPAAVIIIGKSSLTQRYHHRLEYRGGFWGYVYPWDSNYAYVTEEIAFDAARDLMRKATLENTDSDSISEIKESSFFLGWLDKFNQAELFNG